MLIGQIVTSHGGGFPNPMYEKREILTRNRAFGITV